MAVAKKPSREKNNPSLDKAIDKGGSSAKPEKGRDEIALVQLRLPQKMVNEIDTLIENKFPKPTRHHWLLEAVYEKLKHEQES